MCMLDFMCIVFFLLLVLKKVMWPALSHDATLMMLTVVFGYLGSRFDSTELCRLEVSLVMETDVFKTLLNEQEVEAALIAAVRMLHLQHKKPLGTHTQLSRYVCLRVCAGVIPGVR